VDCLQNTNNHTQHYTPEEKTEFEAYIQQRLDMIDLPDKDENFLRERMLTMYANPAINYMTAVE
jgi:hypothetical protein